MQKSYSIIVATLLVIFLLLQIRVQSLERESDSLAIKNQTLQEQISQGTSNVENHDLKFQQKRVLEQQIALLEKIINDKMIGDYK